MNTEQFCVAFKWSCDKHYLNAKPLFVWYSDESDFRAFSLKIITAINCSFLFSLSNFGNSESKMYSVKFFGNVSDSRNKQQQRPYSFYRDYFLRGGSQFVCEGEEEVGLHYYSCVT